MSANMDANHIFDRIRALKIDCIALKAAIDGAISDEEIREAVGGMADEIIISLRELQAEAGDFALLHRGGSQ
ncbi:MAG: hypothetical protein ACR652_10940 [Methylocystis sp.]|uniref:hypothetical protein n=1 Tax=Methylocystis sp. TaxID=1911079 RepID=UPI003DA5E5DE